MWKAARCGTGCVQNRTKALDAVIDFLLSVMASPRSEVTGTFMEINYSLDCLDSTRDCQAQNSVLVDIEL